MVTDTLLLTKKLRQLEDTIRRIEEMDFDQESLMEDVDIQDLLTFRLIQGVETAVDIATHIVSAFGLPVPETAASSFEVLAKEKIIDKKLALSLGKAVGFRNLAVHRYSEIDFARVYRDYRQDLSDLRQFARQIWLFIRKKEKGRRSSSNH